MTLGAAIFLFVLAFVLLHLASKPIYKRNREG